MFRNLDENYDWTWGQNLNNYVTETQEIALNIKTRILSFLGDCFFAVEEGIDHWRYMGYNTQTEYEKAITDVIVATPGVEKVEQLDILLNANRQMTLSFSVYTIYSTTIDSTVPLTDSYGTI